MKYCSFLLTTSYGLEDIVAQELELLLNYYNTKEKIYKTILSPFNLSSYVWVDLITHYDHLNLQNLVPILKQLRSIFHITLIKKWMELDSQVTTSRNVFFENLTEIMKNQVDFSNELNGNKQDKNATVNLPSFRVTTHRTGGGNNGKQKKHDFSSMEIQQYAGEALYLKYGNPVDLKNPQVEVRVDLVNDFLIIGRQMTRDSLDNRIPRVFHSNASLKPSIAFSMAMLAFFSKREDEKSGETKIQLSPSLFHSKHINILDPFTGSGTILMESPFAFYNYAYCDEFFQNNSSPIELNMFGYDIDEEVVSGAQQNVSSMISKIKSLDSGLIPPDNHLYQSLSNIKIRSADALKLSDVLPDNKFNIIISNPPFGKRIGKQINFIAFYQRFLEQASQLLCDGGRMVLLVVKRSAFNKALRSVNSKGLSGSKTLKLLHVRIISMGPVHPGIFLLEKDNTKTE